MISSYINADMSDKPGSSFMYNSSIIKPVWFDKNTPRLDPVDHTMVNVQDDIKLMLLKTNLISHKICYKFWIKLGIMV